MQQALIQARAVGKSFGAQTLFTGAELTLAPGHCIALIGHNGCGKSTLLKILAGLVRPSGGRIDRRPGLSLGYVPEHFPKMNLHAEQYLLSTGRIEGLGKAEIQARCKELFVDFHMLGMTRTPLKYLSKGTLQKVGVVQALLGDHDVLLLDEPLSGQDLASQQVFIEKMEALKARGCALVLSCHEPFLVSRLAERVYEIRDQQLQEVSLSEERFLPKDVLIFGFDPGIQSIPGFLSPYPVETRPGCLHITAPQHGSNGVLLEMLRAGFQLKEFHHASDR